MKKIPSPCIDVCKFKRAGHCIGCSMTKEQKKTFKGGADPVEQLGFIVTQQRLLGRFKHWERAYRRKCEKKKASCPLDQLAANDTARKEKAAAR